MLDRIREFAALIREVLLSKPELVDQDSDAALLDSDRQTRIFGYSIIVTVFLGLGGWAGCAPLESAAIGKGSVQVEGDSKLIQHLEGGIVREILVSSGDYVAEDQALIQLDSTQLFAQLAIIEGRSWSQRAALDRLISERDGASDVTFSAALLELEDARAAEAIANERRLFAARYSDRNGEITVLQQQIIQLEKQIEGLHAVVGAKKEVSDSLEVEIRDLRELLDEGYVDRQRLRELERGLAQTLGEISELEARIATAAVSIDETKSRILQLDRRFVSEVVDEIAMLQEELFDSEQRANAVSDTLARATIRAPLAGVVVKVNPNTLGAVVLPGEELLTIVPDIERLVIDVQLSPMDIDRLRVGQLAEVRFAVFKDAYTISGQLIKLSADSIIDEVSGQPFFEGKVRLDEKDIHLLKDQRLVPGMPAEVLIKTGTRTLLAYVMSPLERMFETALTED